MATLPFPASERAGHDPRLPVGGVQQKGDRGPGEPAVLAYRRPARHGSPAGASTVAHTSGLPLVVLRMPDLDGVSAPAPAADQPASRLASNLVFGAFVTFGVIIIWILLSDPAIESPPPTAPRWKTENAAAASGSESTAPPAHQPLPTWKTTAPSSVEKEHWADTPPQNLARRLAPPAQPWKPADAPVRPSGDADAPVAEIPRWRTDELVPAAGPDAPARPELPAQPEVPAQPEMQSEPWNGPPAAPTDESNWRTQSSFGPEITPAQGAWNAPPRGNAPRGFANRAVQPVYTAGRPASNTSGPAGANLQGTIERPANTHRY